MLDSYPDRFMKFEPLYRAYLDARVPIVGLQPRGKKLAGPTARASVLHRIEQIETAVENCGLNLGAVTHQADMPMANPLGYCELDIDRVDHGCDLSPFTFCVRRRVDEERGHYLFRVPPGTAIRTKLRGTHDVGTWNTVLPGSIHFTDTIYELCVKTSEGWTPWQGESFRIEDLPILDPQQFAAKGPGRQSSTKGALLTRAGVTSDNKVKGKDWVHASGLPETRCPSGTAA